MTYIGRSRRCNLDQMAYNANSPDFFFRKKRCLIRSGVSLNQMFMRSVCERIMIDVLLGKKGLHHQSDER